jgi:SLT domain-containing protein
LRRSIGAGAVGGAMIGFAEGGIVNFPQVAKVAEDGPEVIIPLTKPGRAAQLLQQSGLDKMLGGSGPSQILVFIGNEQLDSRMVTIVERSNTAQALALNHGDRRF